MLTLKSSISVSVFELGDCQSLRFQKKNHCIIVIFGDKIRTENDRPLDLSSSFPNYISPERNSKINILNAREQKQTKTKAYKKISRSNEENKSVCESNR